MILTIILAISTAILIVTNAYKDVEIDRLSERLFVLSTDLNKDNVLLFDVVAAYEEYGVESPVNGDEI